MYESGYEKKVYSPEPTGTKTPMCCKVALDTDLPIPRSAFLTFPFEASLDSPGRAQHDQCRLVPSALANPQTRAMGWANGSCLEYQLKYYCACQNKINKSQLPSGYRWSQRCKCNPKSFFFTTGTATARSYCLSEVHTPATTTLVISCWEGLTMNRILARFYSSCLNMLS